MPESLESRDEEVAFIHRKTHRFDQLMVQIKREKAAALRRLNAIQSPIIRIPNELLSRIFEYASPSLGFQRGKFRSFPSNTHISAWRFGCFQFTLGAVSSHWRQVTWSTPCLWSRIGLDIPASATGTTEESTEETEASSAETDTSSEETDTSTEMDTSAEETDASAEEMDTSTGETGTNTENMESNTKKADTSERKRALFLRLFIENSKGFPLEIALCFSKDTDPNSPHLVHEAVDSLLVEAFPRIKELHLNNPPCRWLNYTSDWTKIRSLSLRFDSPERLVAGSQVIFPLNAPLCQLCLWGALQISSINSQPPWMSLTLLYLVSIPPDLSVRLFCQCPNLVDFYCSSPSRRWLPSERVTLTSPIILQHLTKFHWETDDNPWSRALIRYLHVPVLESMRWCTFDASSDNNGDIQGFFNRLPPSLKLLTLDTTTSNLQYIRGDLNIETLELGMCDTGDLSMLFRKLKPTWQGGQPAVKPLPRLKEVNIFGDIRDSSTMMHVDTLASSYSTAFVEVLEQRLDQSNRVFTLELEATKFRWKPEAQEKLRWLVESGYRVKIIENPDSEF